MKGPKRATKQMAHAHNKNEKDKCEKKGRKKMAMPAQQTARHATNQQKEHTKTAGQTCIRRADTCWQGKEHTPRQRKRIRASTNRTAQACTSAAALARNHTDSHAHQRKSPCTQAAATWQLAHKRQGSVATHTQNTQQHGSPRKHTQHRSNSRATH